MQRCAICGLPDTFPNVALNEAGVCNLCRQHQARQVRLEKDRPALLARFEALVAEHRGQQTYDALMAWSGGKDSTYTLMLLCRRYGLNVLAYTFDNGFISPGALKNMECVADGLGVDHFIFRPRFDLLRRIFAVTAQDPSTYPDIALTRASAVCNACMGLAKGIALRTALEQGVPMMIFGWSPGQVPLTSALFQRTPEMVRSMIAALVEPLKGIVGEGILPYFPEERHFANARHVPIDVAPLAFMEYNEQRVRDEIGALGWRAPEDTDPNSSNCLLNAFANAVHKQQKGFHPYALELAGLVRQGHLSREEALARLDEPESEASLDSVRARLHL
jgi:hypothetical protein